MTVRGFGLYLLAISLALGGCTSAESGPGVAYVEQGDRLLDAYKSNRKVGDDALAAFREAIRRDPHSPAGYVGVARALGTMGDYKEELASAQEAVRRFPTDASAQFALAMALGDNDQQPEAVAAFQRAAASNPAYPQLATQLSWTYMNMGEHAKAVESARRGAITDPTDPFTFRQLGDALMAAGKVEESIPAYRRAIELAPSDPWAYKRLSDAYIGLDRPADAVAVLRQSMARFPNDLLTAIDYGVALDKSGQHEEGMSQLARAETLAKEKLAAKPEDVDLINNLGVAQEYQGKLEPAAATYAHILNVAPAGNAANRLAMSNIANVLTKEKKYDDAADYYHRVYEASKQPADLRMWCLAQFTAGHPAEALDLANRWFSENSAASHTGRYMGIHSYLIALAVPGRASTAGKFLELARADAETGWPLPCVDYLEGKLTEPALLAQATDNDKRTEARTYIGLKQLFTGNPAGADHLRWVEAHGNPHYVERNQAAAWASRTPPPVAGSQPAQ